MSSITPRSTASVSFFLSVVNVRSTRCVKRGSSVDTPRSMSARFARISCAGVGGGALVSSFSSSSCFWFLDLSSAGLISTSGILERSNKKGRQSRGKLKSV
jgi:hypothetical protein